MRGEGGIGRVDARAVYASVAFQSHPELFLSEKGLRQEKARKKQENRRAGKCLAHKVDGFKISAKTKVWGWELPYYEETRTKRVNLAT